LSSIWGCDRPLCKSKSGATSSKPILSFFLTFVCSILLLGSKMTPVGTDSEVLALGAQRFFPPYEMSQLPETGRVLMVGRRRAGKTFLTQELLRRHLGRYRHLVVKLCALDSITGYRNAACGSGPAIETLDDTDWRARLDEISAERSDPAQRREPMMIVLEDFDMDGWKRDPTLMRLFTNARSMNVLLVLHMQYFNSLPPILLANLDQLFLFHEPGVNQLKKLHDEFLTTAFETFDECKAMMQTLSVGWGCLVVTFGATEVRVAVRRSLPPLGEKVIMPRPVGRLSDGADNLNSGARGVPGVWTHPPPAYVGRDSQHQCPLGAGARGGLEKPALESESAPSPNQVSEIATGPQPLLTVEMGESEHASSSLCAAVSAYCAIS